jgi:phosphoribosylformylglycinamidine cyclo-ligase
VGFCVGLVDLGAVVTGDRIEAGDAIIGIPSSGIHSNGLSLARSVLTDLDEELTNGQTAGDMLLEPTVIYVKAVRELLDSDVDVRGLAHITGDGFLNLLRLEAHAGYRIDAPLAVPPVFVHIAERGRVEDAELYEVFNMGCGFCVVVPHDDTDAALELIERHHPGAAVIGRTTTATGVVELPKQGLIGRRGEGFRPAS